MKRWRRCPWAAVHLSPANPASPCNSLAPSCQLWCSRQPFHAGKLGRSCAVMRAAPAATHAFLARQPALCPTRCALHTLRPALRFCCLVTTLYCSGRDRGAWLARTRPSPRSQQLFRRGLASLETLYRPGNKFKVAPQRLLQQAGRGVDGCRGRRSTQHMLNRGWSQHAWAECTSPALAPGPLPQASSQPCSVYICYACRCAVRLAKWCNRTGQWREGSGAHGSYPGENSRNAAQQIYRF